MITSQSQRLVNNPRNALGPPERAFKTLHQPSVDARQLISFDRRGDHALSLPMYHPRCDFGG